MKKRLLGLIMVLAFAVAIVGCKKAEEATPAPGGGGGAPAQTTGTAQQ